MKRQDLRDTWGIAKHQKVTSDPEHILKNEVPL